MEAKRKQRFFQKMDELDDRREFIQGNLGGEKGFLGNRILRKAVYKEFQELVEVTGDLSAMIVREHGRVVEDDYSNLEKAMRILDAGGLLDDLREANGLRNVLVHEYDGVIDKQAYKSIKALLPSMEGFGVKVREWMKGR